MHTYTHSQCSAVCTRADTCTHTYSRCMCAHTCTLTVQCTHARTHSLAQETLALRGPVESAHLLDQTLDQLVRGPQVLGELALQEPGQELSMNGGGTLSPVCVRQWQEMAHQQERVRLLCVLPPNRTARDNVAPLLPDPWFPGREVDSLFQGTFGKVWGHSDCHYWYPVGGDQRCGKYPTVHRTPPIRNLSGPNI